MSEPTTARPGSHDSIVQDGMYFGAEPGDDKSPRPTILDQTRAAASRILVDLRKAIPPSYGTSRTVANDALDAAERAISEAGATIVKSSADARSVANNRDLYPDGRVVRINRIISEADDKVSRAVETINSSVLLMKSSLAEQALPAPPSKTDAVAIRSQALSLLDRVSGEKQQALFTKLATRADPVSGLLLGSYGRDLAEVLWGERLGSAIWKAAHTQAIANAAANGNVHALAVTQATKLTGVAAGLASGWREVNGDLRKLKFS